ncbi:E3 ubiquitin-protein ligase RING1-like [Apostasia shenzhenica]|uniref:E3 ubiquitin-protein ligase RING1-like n=1 Tax=Apostasia shenzhenica TaxID=1088818 RepID=A0A2I0BB22_9ASPA|nr:E3 ubiquitin-protein ligase RING1-like [Apostasia shenzhenica]
MESAAGEAIMAALLRLHPRRLQPLAVDLLLRQRRLSFLLLSPLHFSLALSHLRSLSLPSKTLLLARLLLRSLSLLLSPLQPTPRLRLRDFDAAVLLLAMCDAYDPSIGAGDQGIDWRSIIADRLAGAALSTAGLGGGWWPVIASHVDSAAKCRRLAEGVRPLGGVVTAAPAAAMSLAAAESGECAICGEEIASGGAMPCGHSFHWGCILQWLRMRNTCPCCRFELPTDDVYGEIERVWRMGIKISARGMFQVAS